MTTRRAKDHHPPAISSAATSWPIGRTLWWVADITFLPTVARFLDLAVVLDAWSRRILGWAFSSDVRTRVVLDALDMALGQKTDNVVHHSDRGSQYTSISFGNFCKEARVRPSTGDAYDVAMCESDPAPN